jgi:hypothetical protein
MALNMISDYPSDSEQLIERVTSMTRTGLEMPNDVTSDDEDASWITLPYL